MTAHTHYTDAQDWMRAGQPAKAAECWRQFLDEAPARWVQMRRMALLYLADCEAALEVIPPPSDQPAAK